MSINKEEDFLREFYKKAELAGLNFPYSYKDFILEEFKKKPDLDMDYYFIYENRIKLLEDKIGYKLPDDFVEFMKEYEGKQVVDGEWFTLEMIELARDYDIINYSILEEMPELLNEEDCNHIIPIFVDNGSYVVMDLREDGKGVFIIWHDEDEIGFQQPTFGEFIENLREEIKKAKLEGNDNFCFNYLDEYIYD